MNRYLREIVLIVFSFAVLFSSCSEGADKGSLGTFLERAGNDTDISSLLLALYRAANIPCRYITGTIDIPVDKAKSLSGTNYAENIGTLFASAGIPATYSTSDGEIVFFHNKQRRNKATEDWISIKGIITELSFPFFIRAKNMSM